MAIFPWINMLGNDIVKGNSRFNILLVLSVSNAVLGEDVEWGYVGHPLPPANWKDEFPLCGGTNQSPVDIVDADVEETDLGKLKFKKYNKDKIGMKLENTGHSIKVSITEKVPKVKKGGLDAKAYALGQFHFHVGNTSAVGSEHLVNGKAYPAELHFVHFDNSFDTLGDAVNAGPSALAVLGVFIEVSEEDNSAFNEIIEKLPYIKDSGNSVKLQSFKLESLLPDNTRQFYRYQGSLTTPPCFESVQWTVFKDTISMSESQLDKFREVCDLNGLKLVDNFRPVQPLNGRKIYCSRKEQGS